jgi:hypothetical protein
MPRLQASIGGWGNNRRFTQKFLGKVGFLVEREAKLNAPVDTARLKGSISTAWRGHAPQIDAPASHGDGVKQPTRSMTVKVGSGVNYATAVHETHRTDGKFLKRALNKTKSRVASLAMKYDSRS